MLNVFSLLSFTVRQCIVLLCCNCYSTFSLSWSTLITFHFVSRIYSMNNFTCMRHVALGVLENKQNVCESSGTVNSKKE